MLTNSHLTTVLPVEQLDRARDFYERTLGLNPEGMHADGSFVMRTDDGSTISLLPRPGQQKSGTTALSFEVDDIEGEIKSLEQRGVHFEDYDLPDLKTVNHVFRSEGEMCAWFPDTEGNILCIHQELSQLH